MAPLKQALEPAKPFVSEIQRCRICGNPHLEMVIDLGRQAIASLFDDGRPENQVDDLIPLEVVRCREQSGRTTCGFVQLRQTVSPDILYRDYGYRSGVNTTMRRHLENLTHEVEAAVGVREGDIVVDIGANDGTSLLAYRHPGIQRVAYEPSDIRPDTEDHGILYIPRVFNQRDFDERFPDRRARVVTSIAMFYDLDAPVEFCRQLRNILADDGIWVLEMNSLEVLLGSNTFNVIAHERLGYYSVQTLQYLLEQTGLELTDVQFNDANGGSIRCWIRKQRQDPRFPRNSARIARALEDERRKGYHSSERFAQFRRDVEGIQRDLMAILESCRREGKKVYGYGASTKANVLLQYCGITPQHLVAIADRTPQKVGRLTPGTKIRICSEEEARAARPDDLLIFPWYFLDEFLTREHVLRAQGTKFIVPFPKVRIV